MLFIKYLRGVKQHSKKLFIGMCTIITLTLLTNVLRYEIAPLYVYSMYSSPPKVKEKHIIFEIEADNEIWKEHTLWGHHGRIQILYTLDYYYKTVKNDSIPIDANYYIKKYGLDNWETEANNKFYTSIEDVRKYPKWLKMYMESILNRNINELKVYALHLIYKEDGQVQLIKREILCQA